METHYTGHSLTYKCTVLVYKLKGLRVMASRWPERWLQQSASAAQHEANTKSEALKSERTQ